MAGYYSEIQKMKIVHICISAPYIDGWGYQENLLPRYLQKAGTENYVIASMNDFPVYLKPEVKVEIMTKGTDYQIDGIQVRRIKTKQLTTSLLIAKGLSKMLDEIHPDVIFHHNFNCTSLVTAARYAKKKGIPFMVDNHADIINISHNKLWAFVYYRLLIGMSCKLIRKTITTAYGVTQARCDFMHDWYGVSKDIIKLLPIGADTDQADTIPSKESLREKYCFQKDDFIVVSGGKMGADKGTDQLINTVNGLKIAFPNIRLVLFGAFEDNDTLLLAQNSDEVSVHGWCDREKTLELLKMADVACWPVHHTTLIEDAVSVCTPIIVRKTGNTEHLVERNGAWVDGVTTESLKTAILSFLSNQGEAQKSDLQSACEKMKNQISYDTIADKLLKDISVH